MNLGLYSNGAKNTRRQYNISINNTSEAAKKLSSGYRINSAADDAAGLSISEKMRKQIRGLNKASENIVNGRSYVQVADSALSEVQAMMHRMTQLSVQASNDTCTDADRLAIDKEFQALKKSMNGIFEQTEFNTKKIWDTNTDDRVQIGTEKVTAVSSLTTGSQSFKITEINKWTLPKSLSDTSDHAYYHLEASESDGVRVKWTAYNGKTYNTDWVKWPECLDDIDAGGKLDIPVNSTTLDMTAYPELVGTNFTFSCNIAAAATAADVAKSLDGVSIQATPSQYSSAYITTKDGKVTNSYSLSDQNYGGTNLSVSFSPTLLYQSLLASDVSFERSTPDSVIPNDKQDFINSTGSNKWESSFTFGTGAANNLSSASTKGEFTVTATSTNVSHAANNATEQADYWWYYSDYYNRKISNGLMPIPTNGDAAGTLNQLHNTTETSASGNTLASTTSGGYIRVSFNLTGSYDLPKVKSSNNDADAFSTTNTTGNAGSMYMTIYGVTPNTTSEQIKNLLDKIKSVDINHNNSASNTIYRMNTKDVLIDSPIYEAQISLKIQSSDIAFDNIEIAYSSLRLQNLGLADTNTTTRANAQKAITEISNALDIVSAQRSLFGSYENRFTYANTLANNTAENVQASESLLRDTNMADEMVNYSKNQILSQVGESVLSQANTSMERVLSLFQF